MYFFPRYLIVHSGISTFYIAIHNTLCMFLVFDRTLEMIDDDRLACVGHDADTEREDKFFSLSLSLYNKTNHGKGKVIIQGRQDQKEEKEI